MSAKPIIVCGVDFSGTSMLAGLLHSAGVNMGDVESAEDVARSKRPVRYRIFQDRELDEWLGPLASELITLLPHTPKDWLRRLAHEFAAYVWQRHKRASQRWGVKCNGLLFLALHTGFDHSLFEWLTTCRPLEDSMDSCFDKLGLSTEYASMLAAEYVAWKHLVTHQKPLTFAFDDLLHQPDKEAERLSEHLWPGEKRALDVSQIDPRTKGIVPCRGL
jgi:hypothetical protein